MRKAFISMIIILACNQMSIAQAFPTNTSSETINIDQLSEQWEDFNFKWNGFEDRKVSITIENDDGFIDMTGWSVMFKMTGVVAGGSNIAYITRLPSAITVTDSNFFFTVSHTNKFPNKSYKGNVVLLDNVTTNTVRTLGRGTIRVVNSLFDDEDGTFANPSITSIADYITKVDASSTYELKGQNARTDGYVLSTSGASNIWVNAGTGPDERYLLLSGADEMEGDLNFGNNSAINIDELQVNGAADITGTKASGESIVCAGGIRVDTNSSYGAYEGIIFGDGDTYIGESSDDTIRFELAGVGFATMDQGEFQSTGNSDWSLQRGASDALPSFAGKNDSNSGMIIPGGDTVRFSTHGTNRMTIADTVVDISGNLDVGGTATTDSLLVESSAILSDTTRLIGKNDASPDLMFVKDSDNLSFGVTHDSMTWAGSNTESFILMYGGGVGGIGGYLGLNTTTTNGVVLGVEDGSFLTFYTNSTEKAASMNPAGDWDFGGGATIAGDLDVGGTCTATTLIGTVMVFVGPLGTNQYHAAIWQGGTNYYGMWMEGASSTSLWPVPLIPAP